MTVAPWIEASFPAIRIVIIVLMCLIAIGVIITIFMQPSKADGAGAITGQASDSYFAQPTKEKSYESSVKKATIALCVIGAVLSILFFVTVAIFSPY